MSEWQQYGDPRNTSGHFRPKHNLDIALEDSGVSKEKLAAMMTRINPNDEIKRSRLSQWVSGRLYMSDYDVARAAICLNESVDWLLDLTWVRRGRDLVDYSPKRRELVRLLTKMEMPGELDELDEFLGTTEEVKRHNHLVECAFMSGVFDSEGAQENIKGYDEDRFHGDLRDPAHLACEVVHAVADFQKLYGPGPTSYDGIVAKVCCLVPDGRNVVSLWTD